MKKYELPKEMSPIEIASLNEIMHSPLKLIVQDSIAGEESCPAQEKNHIFNEFLTKELAWKIHKLTLKRKDFGKLEYFKLDVTNFIDYDNNEHYSSNFAIKLEKKEYPFYLGYGSYRPKKGDLGNSLLECIKKTYVVHELE